MASARRGFLPAGGTSSVFGFIRIGRFVRVFVDHGLRDHVSLRSPVAEIQQPAAFAAERKVLVDLRARGLLANGTTVLHTTKSRHSQATAEALHSPRTPPHSLLE